MTKQISDLLESAAHRAVPVVRGVTDAQLGAPTPCAEYDVRDLLNHLTHVVVEFQKLAAKQDADFTSTPGYVDGGDWRARFAEETARLAEAWAAPGAEEGETGQMTMPARTVGGLALIDLTVHPWDLARSTGQDFTPDPACVDELTVLLEHLAPGARQAKVFGEPYPVPEGASAFEALLATTGRDPHWRPARN